jgi:hypothetical protein
MERSRRQPRKRAAAMTYISEAERLAFIAREQVALDLEEAEAGERGPD